VPMMIPFSSSFIEEEEGEVGELGRRIRRVSQGWEEGEVWICACRRCQRGRRVRIYGVMILGQVFVLPASVDLGS
jgi:hypothetical protein